MCSVDVVCVLLTIIQRSHSCLADDVTIQRWREAVKQAATKRPVQASNAKETSQFEAYLDAKIAGRETSSQLEARNVENGRRVNTRLPGFRGYLKNRILTEFQQAQVAEMQRSYWNERKSGNLEIDSLIAITLHIHSGL